MNDEYIWIMQIPKESHILPENEAINDNIKKPREHWICNLGSCGNTHCYISPDDPDHLPLGHQQLGLWAAAMVRFHQESLADLARTVPYAE